MSKENLTADAEEQVDLQLASEPPESSPKSELSMDAATDMAAQDESSTDVVALLSATQDRLASLELAVESLAKQVSFVPPQVRSLGNKVDGLTTSVSDPRCRSLLLNTLSVYDLAEQMRRACATSPADNVDHLRNYEVLVTQIEQMLAANGLSKIAADGLFDPDVHRAVLRGQCDDPAQDGRVTEVIREGFRSEQAVLRSAEVVVARYSKEETKSQD